MNRFIYRRSVCFGVATVRVNIAQRSQRDSSIFSIATAYFCFVGGFRWERNDIRMSHLCDLYQQLLKVLSCKFVSPMQLIKMSIPCKIPIFAYRCRKTASSHQMGTAINYQLNNYFKHSSKLQWKKPHVPKIANISKLTDLPNFGSVGIETSSCGSHCKADMYSTSIRIEFEITWSQAYTHRFHLSIAIWYIQQP